MNELQIHFPEIQKVYDMPRTGENNSSSDFYRSAIIISDNAFPENVSFHCHSNPYYTDRKLEFQEDYVTVLLLMYLRANLNSFYIKFRNGSHARFLTLFKSRSEHERSEICRTWNDRSIYAQYSEMETI